MNTDIIADTLDIARKVIGNLPPEQWAEIERMARQRWGGEGAYVRKKATDLSARDAAIRREYRQGKVGEMMAKYQVSRSTVFRVIGAKKRK